MKTPIMVNKKKPNFISKSRSYISIYVYIIVFLKGVVLKLKKNIGIVNIMSTQSDLRQQKHQ